jgi:hypothetical protein
MIDRDHNRDHLTKADAVTVAAIEADVRTLAEAHAMIMRFQRMIRARADEDLDPWIRDAEKSLIASFARGVLKDKAAVRAAIKEPWSNGRTGGLGQPPQADQAPDVRPRQARLDRSQTSRSGVIVTEIASDLKFHAETHSGVSMQG